MKKKCYRIIDDEDSWEKAYKVQIRKNFLGIKWWKDCNYFRYLLFFTTNSFSSIKKAKQWIKDGRPKYKEPSKTLWISENCKT